MNRFALILRNLRYHLRGNLAVMLGAAVGAAVLTGALLVGDSLRGSLRERTERQLGNIDTILIGPRFVRQELAAELPGQVRGALLLQGAVRREAPDKPDGELRAGKVTVWGVDGKFGISSPLLDEDKPDAILSASLAKALQAEVGQTIHVGVQKASAMPRSSFLSKRGVTDTTSDIELTVRAILPDGDPFNSLSLSISPALPLNMFVPRAFLQRRIEQPGRINALLGSGESAQSLQSALRQKLTLDVWGVKVRVPETRKAYVSVESTRMLLDPPLVAAVEQTVAELELTAAKTYVYLANTIQHGKQEIPYSIVAALDASKGAPLGPFLPEGVKELQPNDIVLVDWQESPIKIGPADKDAKITLRYFNPEVEAKLEESEHTFTYRGMIPLAGVADDRDLTPDFPGITDKANLRAWNPPFEINLDRIKQRDEDYWSKYRTTPKAYIRLEDGQKLWGTRFGDVTSIRIVAPWHVDWMVGPTMVPFKPRDARLQETRDKIAERLLTHLDPASGGLEFQPIRQRMLEAGQGSTDFGMLFLSFSFFLIVAALLLVGLLFRLNLDRRSGEIGLLRATGFPLRTVRWMLLSEGLLVAILGSLLGLLGALLYADLMIRVLVTLWPTKSVSSYLGMHVTSTSLAIGFFSAVFMSGVAILWALRSLNKVAPANLLKGDTTPAFDPKHKLRPSPWPIRIAVVALLCAIVLAISAPFMPPGEPQAGTFFGSGALLLTAGLSLLWAWLKRSRHGLIGGHGFEALAKLGSRNASRNPTRSLLTAGLLASAAFLLVAVEAFRREPEKDFLQKNGGSGGFGLVAQSATPIDFDLNDEEGRDQIEDSLRRYYQNRKRTMPDGKLESIPAAERTELVKQDMATLESAKIFRFRVQGGDDASCLNLYQALRPRLLGVPANLVERGGFTFSAMLADRDNPWKQLDAVGDPIPCIVEANTAMWMLKKGLGDTFTVPDADNRNITLKIVALLKDSVFQSEVLIPDCAFRKHFPRVEGFGYFLIESPPDQQAQVARILTCGLDNYGFEAEPSRAKVEAYLAVQNTYLTTFQLLGGFGLLLGVLGLSVVLLRSIWERRAELALLRCLGYRARSLNLLVMAENALLLILGLGAGIIAALAAVAPHLTSGGRIPWSELGLMLGAVFVVGLTVAFLAVTATLRAPLIPALREE